MRRRVVITGIGCITPIGNNIETFYESLLEGKNGIDKITLFDATDSKCKLAAEVKHYNPRDHFDQKQVKRIDRVVQFGLIASKEAWEDSKLDTKKIDHTRLGVFVGTGVGGIQSYYEETIKFHEKGFNNVNPLCVPKFIPNMIAGHISMAHQAKGIVSTIITACAAGTHAIGESYRLIKDGYQDIMIAVGSEACINPVMQAGFINMNAHSRSSDKNRASIPFDKEREGFVLGEGSGALILENYEHALKRNAKIYGEVAGYGFTSDAYHMTAPDPEGEGVIRCMKQAIEDANIDHSDIGYINAHGTGTPYNDKFETKAIKKVFGEAANTIPVSSTKSMIGHLLGAAGTVEAIASLMALNHGIIHQTIGLVDKDPECDLNYVVGQHRNLETSYVMSNSFGFGGHNGSIIFKKLKTSFERMHNMEKFIKELTMSIIGGHEITYDEALKLMSIDADDEETLAVLFESSNKLRMEFVGDKVDLCTIINAKSGACSEDCKFCAQSAHYKTKAQVYDLLDYENILEKALEVQRQGAHRFSLVTSGKGVTDGEEFNALLGIYRKLRKDTTLKLCASHGIISTEQAKKLKEVGVTMYHHNVETSEDFYSSIVSTHDYSDRVDTIKNIAKAGLEVCSGGIFGLGESIEDRVKMAFEIKKMNVKSIPLNVLMPVKDTPLEHNVVLKPMDILKSMALFRFVVPDSFIRYAGGRMALKDKQAIGFKAGVNAALVGDFLTTIGSKMDEDKDMILCAGLKL